MRHSNFREKIYTLAKKIPPGKVATYGLLARLAGKPRAARVVGYFMRTNPFAPEVPCHRVVGSDGRLVGYSGKKGTMGKREMLLSEGVSFRGEKVDLEKCLVNKLV